MEPTVGCQLLEVTALLRDPRLMRSHRPQRHRFHELVYVIRGRYRVETLGARWEAGPGWLFCYRAGQDHRSGFALGRGQESPQAILLQWATTGPVPEYPQAYYDAARRWRHLLSWLLDLYTSGQGPDRAAAEALLPVLLRELSRAADRRQSLLPAVNVYVADHAGAPIRIGHLAASLGLSRSHFSRNFRRLTGGTPQQYVERLRLEQARRLLGNRALTLAEIAARCGFSSGPHLSRRFRRHFQRLPSQCR